MSLILEALRRSEAERRLGEAPGLHAADAWRALPARHGGRGRPAWPWWLLALGLTAALAAVAGAWWWPRAAEAPPTGPAGTSAVAAAQDPPPPRAAPIAPTAEPASFEQVSVAPAPAPAPAPPAAPAIASPTPAAAVAPAAAEAALPPGPLATAPRDDATQGASEDARPPSLAALDPSRRAALPPLRLGLHIWDAAPERRRVVIDGQRHVEGDWVSADVRLVEIVRGGCIVEVDGRRWWLGVP